ncbi:MAG: hypothetical protein KDD64_03760 [Bdellovibrionales bacterium]|nr:hypothetical protein [Bdellovibrionales bacterium]
MAADIQQSNRDLSAPTLDDQLEVANDVSDLKFKLDRAGLSGARLNDFDRGLINEGLMEIELAPGFEIPAEHLSEYSEGVTENRRHLLTPHEFLEGDARQFEQQFDRELETLEAHAELDQMFDLQQFLLDAGQSVKLAEVTSPDIFHPLGLAFEGEFIFAESQEVHGGEVSGKALFTGSVVYADGSSSHFLNLPLTISSASVVSVGLRSAA